MGAGYWRGASADHETPGGPRLIYHRRSDGSIAEVYRPTDGGDKFVPHEDEDLDELQEYNINHLGLLIIQYEPECWWFEVCVCLHKYLIVSFCVMLTPHFPSTQILMAVLVSIMYLSLFQQASPYIEDIDDVLAYCANLTLLVIFILAAYSRFGNLIEKAYGGRPQTEVAWLTELVQAASILIFAVMILASVTGVLEVKHAIDHPGEKWELDHLCSSEGTKHPDDPEDMHDMGLPSAPTPEVEDLSKDTDTELNMAAIDLAIEMATNDEVIALTPITSPRETPPREEKSEDIGVEPGTVGPAEPGRLTRQQSVNPLTGKPWDSKFAALAEVKPTSSFKPSPFSRSPRKKNWRKLSVNKFGAKKLTAKNFGFAAALTKARSKSVDSTPKTVDAPPKSVDAPSKIDDDTPRFYSNTNSANSTPKSDDDKGLVEG